MALTSEKILAIDQINGLPSTDPIRLIAINNYETRFGVNSYRIDAAALQTQRASASQDAGTSFTDVTGLNFGTGVVDTSPRQGVNFFGVSDAGFTAQPSTGISPRGNLTGGATNVNNPDLPGGGGTNIVPVPPTRRTSNEIGCDYRYSFGCPVFSKRQTDAGCRVLIPIYRTCYPIPTVFRVGGTASYALEPELYGTFEITSAIQFYGGSYTSTTRTSQNGKQGTLTVEGLRLTPDGLRAAITQDLTSVKSLEVWTSSRTATGEEIYIDSKRKLPLDVVFTNLEDPLSSSPLGELQPIASIDAVVEDLIRKCDFTNIPSYCIVSQTFTADQAPPPTISQGPFPGNVEEQTGVRNTTQTVRREYGTDDPLVRVPIPGKPCQEGTPVQYTDFQDYEVQYGIPLFVDVNRTVRTGQYVPNSLVFRTESQLVGTGIEYRRETTNFETCTYVEETTEYTEDDPANPCFSVIKKDVYRVYQNGNRQLYTKGYPVTRYRKQDVDCAPETLKVYHPFDLGKDYIPAKIRAKTKGLFDGSQTLECHHTSSIQPTSSKNHYYEITDCDTCGKTPYFAVAYGHNRGSGSVWSEGELNDTPTRAIYSQYRLIALEMPETEFTFYTNGVATSSRDVYVVNFSRNGMLDRVDPGNWELALAELRGGSYANNVFTGSNVAVSSSNKVLTFIDDSGDRSDTISCTHDPYVSYDIVSGSLNNGAYPTSSKHTYGVMYPNLGILILDPYKLNTELGFNTVTGSNVAGDNAFKLFTSISGSGVFGNYMKARNVKYKTTNHYFVRVSAPLANYSNNPTYVTGNEGQFLHACFEKNPQTYITTVGLYDDLNQLLAVAKLSKPINKSFDNDVLIKIRLNW